MHALFALALLAQGLQAPFALDTLRPARGPEVLWHRLPSPLVSLRLSVPLPPDLPTGAAELRQELARDSATHQARRFGAALEFSILGDEAAVAVTGPADAFDALVAILRTTTAQPDLSAASLTRARARADDRVLATLERPQPRLETLLRARLAARQATGPALHALDPETIRALAARLHWPAALRVIVVGDPPVQIVRSAFADWPARAASPPRVDDAAAPLPDPQAHYAWAALAFPLDADPATLAVAAELVARRIRDAGVLGGTAEAWVEAGRPALVLLGGASRDDPTVAGAARISAFPAAEDDALALTRFLRRLVAEAAALAGPEAVADAAASLRRALLLESRTVAGRATLLGRWSGPQGGGRPPVHNVLDRLERVRLDDVRTLLNRALATTPIVAEVRP